MEGHQNATLKDGFRGEIKKKKKERKQWSAVNLSFDTVFQDE